MTVRSKGALIVLGGYLMVLDKLFQMEVWLMSLRKDTSSLDLKVWVRREQLKKGWIVLLLMKYEFVYTLILRWRI